MIRLVRPRRGEGPRDRAARRLMARHEAALHAGDVEGLHFGWTPGDDAAQPAATAAGHDPAGPDATADAAAEAAMARLWELTGAVAGDPRLRAALAADLAALPPPALPEPPRRRLPAIAAGLALMLAGAGGGATWWAMRHTPAPLAEPGRSVATSVGQRARMVLADSSSVALDTDSAVAVRMDERARSVTLQRGRAFFRVAKDPRRPFIVTAGDKRVRAVGTEFEVRLAGDQVIVTVVEGTVEVTGRSGGPVQMTRAPVHAGSQLVARDDARWAKRAIDPRQSTSWLAGRLSFMGEPLGEAVREMNRYSHQKLVFRGGQIPDQRIVGVFRSGDTLALAQAIELNGFGRIVATEPDRIEVEAAR